MAWNDEFYRCECASCGSYGVKLWLGMVSVTGMSVRVVARTKGLHLIKQSRVMASDVLIWCREYELCFVLGTPPSVPECGS